jgi:c-di-GMP-binding flagellar brake protein YcgR
MIEMAVMNKRRYERVSCLCDVTVSVLPGGTAIAARCLDLSLGGVGLITQNTFQTGQVVALTFFLKDATKKEVRERVTGRVVHLRADVDANRIGVEFLEPLQGSQCPVLMYRLLNGTG